MGISQYIALTSSIPLSFLWGGAVMVSSADRAIRYPLGNVVYPHIPTHLPPFLRSPRNLGVIFFTVTVAAAGVTSYMMTRRKLTPEEIEKLRRDRLSSTGRITDGSITETHWINPGGPEESLTTPTVLIYRYMIGGVTYECAQDVSTMPDLVRHVRVDLPVQVRFNQRSPGDSIVVSESWSGLRLGAPIPKIAIGPGRTTKSTTDRTD
jgi:hypothetical protein